MNQDKKRKLWKIGIPILAGIILLMGVSYAWFTLVLNGAKENVIKTGNLSLILGEEGNTVSLENAFPITTEEGLQSEGYTFQIKNDGNLASEYRLYLEDDTLEAGEERIDPKYIRYSLDKDDTLVTENGSMLLNTLEDNLLSSYVIMPKGIHKYKLRLWVDYDADSGAMNKVFKRKLRIEAVIAEVDNSCFVTNGNVITGYNDKDSDGNACPKDVAIPSMIRGSTITSIGNNAFYNKGLTSVVIPNTVTNIGSSAFSRNQLTSIDIPSSVNKLDSSVFTNNQFPDEEAFIYNRKSDGSINYESLNSYAGAKRDNVVFPNRIKIIDHYSCANLSLTSITLPEGLLTIGAYAFQGNQLTSLTIPSSVIGLDGSAFTGNRLNDEDAFIYRRTSSGEDRSYLLTYVGARRDNIVIPDNVKTIGASSFSGINIMSITIPNSVTSIEQNAFLGNSLTTIDIPKSVTFIGSGAFNRNQLPDSEAFIYKRNSDGSIDNTTLVSYGGAKRENIVVPSNVINIGNNSFFNTRITSITLPEGLLSIGEQAFAANLLTIITIPSTVTSIGGSAFRKQSTWNPGLKTIINKTGRSFDWGNIINGSSGYNFVTGTVGNSAGNVVISES